MHVAYSSPLPTNDVCSELPMSPETTGSLSGKHGTNNTNSTSTLSKDHNIFHLRFATSLYLPSQSLRFYSSIRVRRSPGRAYRLHWRSAKFAIRAPAPRPHLSGGSNWTTPTMSKIENALSKPKIELYSGKYFAACAIGGIIGEFYILKPLE